MRHPEHDRLSRYPPEIKEALDAFSRVHGRPPDTNDPADLQWLRAQVPPDAYERALDVFVTELVESECNRRVADGTAEIAAVGRDGQPIYRGRREEETEP